MTVNPHHDLRYHSNILIPEIGYKGQKKISNARVLVIGAGGLGSPALMYLAGAGVGALGIIDHDRVELSNLQRQMVHSTGCIGWMKADSAAMRLIDINPEICIERYYHRLEEKNGSEIIGRYDFIIEATDNFESKFVINDLCIRQGVPFCHGGILGMRGQVMTVIPGECACYRCIFGEIPDESKIDTAEKAGVLGPVAGVIGAIQAAEAIKYVTDCGRLLTQRLLTVDALSMKFREILLPQPSCRVCRESGY
jgi:molybdopterin/thiamine biosynthesis adenylyltransferase